MYDCSRHQISPGGNSKRVKAFCSDCGAEVETDDIFGKGTETYRCPKCGAYGTITRKASEPSFIQLGKDEAPVVASISLNVLDILDLNVGGTRTRCLRSGSYSSTWRGRCPFCDQQLA